jgi:hypothetical protein
MAAITDRGRAEARLTAQQWETSWADLVADAAKAHRALFQLIAAPTTVAALTDRLHPAPKLEAKELERLLHDLDNDEFAVRERATKQIEKLGEAARPAIEAALASPDASPELRRRLERLRSLLAVPAGECLRELRALEVLERLGTPEARKLLQKLAAGASEARLTREANAALVRLGRGRASP